MRVKRLREILDGPFLLAEERQTSAHGSEHHVREGMQSHSAPGEVVNDRAERED